MRRLNAKHENNTCNNETDTSDTDDHTENKRMEPGSNYIQTIHNLILAIMDLKSQRGVALEGFIRARHVPRTENCRRLRPGIILKEACHRFAPAFESDGLVH